MALNKNEPKSVVIDQKDDASSDLNAYRYVIEKIASHPETVLNNDSIRKMLESLSSATIFSDLSWPAQVIDKSVYCVVFHTLKLMLMEKWEQIAEHHMQEIRSYIELLIQKISKDRTIMHACQYILKNLENPWNNPALIEVVSGVPSELSDNDLKYLMTENGFIFLCRLKKLCEAKCHNNAYTLASKILLALDQVDKNTLFYNMISENQLHFIKDVQICLKYKQLDDIKFLEEVQAIPFNEGLEWVKRLQLDTKNIKFFDKYSPKVAKFIIDVFMAKSTSIQIGPDFVNVYREIVREWFAQNKHFSPEELHENARRIFSTAISNEHFHYAYDVLNEMDQSNTDLVQLVLCIRTISDELNVLERLRHEDLCSLETVIEREVKLSSHYIRLSELLGAHTNLVKECVLTAFSLNPVPEYYNLVMQYSSDCQNSILNDFITCTLAENSVGKSTIVKDSNWTGSVLGSSLVVSNIGASFETIIIPDETLNDLSSILLGPRAKFLSWLQSWSKLNENCHFLLNGKKEIVRQSLMSANNDLKYLDIDYNRYRNLKEADFSGIEEGYEGYEDSDHENNQSSSESQASLMVKQPKNRTKKARTDTKKSVTLARSYESVSAIDASPRSVLDINIDILANIVSSYNVCGDISSSHLDQVRLDLTKTTPLRPNDSVTSVPAQRRRNLNFGDSIIDSNSIKKSISAVDINIAIFDNKLTDITVGRNSNVQVSSREIVKTDKPCSPFNPSTGELITRKPYKPRGPYKPLKSKLPIPHEDGQVNDRITSEGTYPNSGSLVSSNSRLATQANQRIPKSKRLCKRKMKITSNHLTTANSVQILDGDDVTRLSKFIRNIRPPLQISLSTPQSREMSSIIPPTDKINVKILNRLCTEILPKMEFASSNRKIESNVNSSTFSTSLSYDTNNCSQFISTIVSTTGVNNHIEEFKYTSSIQQKGNRQPWDDNVISSKRRKLTSDIVDMAGTSQTANLQIPLYNYRQFHLNIPAEIVLNRIGALFKRATENSSNKSKDTKDMKIINSDFQEVVSSNISESVNSSTKTCSTDSSQTSKIKDISSVNSCFLNFQNAEISCLESIIQVDLRVEKNCNLLIIHSLPVTINNAMLENNHLESAEELSLSFGAEVLLPVNNRYLFCVTGSTPIFKELSSNFNAQFVLTPKVKAKCNLCKANEQKNIENLLCIQFNINDSLEQKIDENIVPNYSEEVFVDCCRSNNANFFKIIQAENVPELIKLMHSTSYGLSATPKPLSVQNDIAIMLAIAHALQSIGTTVSVPITMQNLINNHTNDPESGGYVENLLNKHIKELSEISENSHLIFVSKTEETTLTELFRDHKSVANSLVQYRWTVATKRPISHTVIKTKSKASRIGNNIINVQSQMPTTAQFSSKVKTEMNDAHVLNLNLPVETNEALADSNDLIDNIMSPETLQTLLDGTNEVTQLSLQSNTDNVKTILEPMLSDGDSESASGCFGEVFFTEEVIFYPKRILESITVSSASSLNDLYLITNKPLNDISENILSPLHEGTCRYLKGNIVASLCKLNASSMYNENNLKTSTIKELISSKKMKSQKFVNVNLRSTEVDQRENICTSTTTTITTTLTGIHCVCVTTAVTSTQPISISNANSACSHTRYDDLAGNRSSYFKAAGSITPPDTFIGTRLITKAAKVNTIETTSDAYMTFSKSIRICTPSSGNVIDKVYQSLSAYENTNQMANSIRKINIIKLEESKTIDILPLVRANRTGETVQYFEKLNVITEIDSIKSSAATGESPVTHITVVAKTDMIAKTVTLNTETLASIGEEIDKALQPIPVYSHANSRKTAFNSLEHRTELPELFTSPISNIAPRLDFFGNFDVLNIDKLLQLTASSIATITAPTWTATMTQASIFMEEQAIYLNAEQAALFNDDDEDIVFRIPLKTYSRRANLQKKANQKCVVLQPRTPTKFQPTRNIGSDISMDSITHLDETELPKIVENYFGGFTESYGDNLDVNKSFENFHRNVSIAYSAVAVPTSKLVKPAIYDNITLSKNILKDRSAFESAYTASTSKIINEGHASITDERSEKNKMYAHKGKENRSAYTTSKCQNSKKSNNVVFVSVADSSNIPSSESSIPCRNVKTTKIQCKTLSLSVENLFKTLPINNRFMQPQVRLERSSQETILKYTKKIVIDDHIIRLPYVHVRPLEEENWISSPTLSGIPTVDYQVKTDSGKLCATRGRGRPRKVLAQGDNSVIKTTGNYVKMGEFKNYNDARKHVIAAAHKTQKLHRRNRARISLSNENRSCSRDLPYNITRSCPYSRPITINTLPQPTKTSYKNKYITSKSDTERNLNTGRQREDNRNSKGNVNDFLSNISCINNPTYSLNRNRLYSKYIRSNLYYSNTKFKSNSDINSTLNSNMILSFNLNLNLNMDQCRKSNRQAFNYTDSINVNIIGNNINNSRKNYKSNSVNNRIIKNQLRSAKVYNSTCNIALVNIKKKSWNGNYYERDTRLLRQKRRDFDRYQSLNNRLSNVIINGDDMDSNSSCSIMTAKITDPQTAADVAHKKNLKEKQIPTLKTKSKLKPKLKTIRININISDRNNKQVMRKMSYELIRQESLKKTTDNGRNLEMFHVSSDDDDNNDDADHDADGDGEYDDNSNSAKDMHTNIYCDEDNVVDEDDDGDDDGDADNNADDDDGNNDINSDDNDEGDDVDNNNDQIGSSKRSENYCGGNKMHGKKKGYTTDCADNVRMIANNVNLIEYDYNDCDDNDIIDISDDGRSYKECDIDDSKTIEKSGNNSASVSCIENGNDDVRNNDYSRNGFCKTKNIYNNYIDFFTDDDDETNDDDDDDDDEDYRNYKQYNRYKSAKNKKRKKNQRNATYLKRSKTQINNNSIRSDPIRYTQSETNRKCLNNRKLVAKADQVVNPKVQPITMNTRQNRHSRENFKSSKNKIKRKCSNTDCNSISVGSMISSETNFTSITRKSRNRLRTISHQYKYNLKINDSGVNLMQKNFIQKRTVSDCRSRSNSNSSYNGSNYCSYPASNNKIIIKRKNTCGKRTKPKCNNTEYLSNDNKKSTNKNVRIEKSSNSNIIFNSNVNSNSISNSNSYSQSRSHSYLNTRAYAIYSVFVKSNFIYQCNEGSSIGNIIDDEFNLDFFIERSKNLDRKMNLYGKFNDQTVAIKHLMKKLALLPASDLGEFNSFQPCVKSADQSLLSRSSSSENTSSPLINASALSSLFTSTRSAFQYSTSRALTSVSELQANLTPSANDLTPNYLNLNNLEIADIKIFDLLYISYFLSLLLNFRYRELDNLLYSIISIIKYITVRYFAVGTNSDKKLLESVKILRWVVKLLLKCSIIDLYSSKFHIENFVETILIFLSTGQISIGMTCFSESQHGGNVNINNLLKKIYSVLHQEMLQKLYRALKMSLHRCLDFPSFHLAARFHFVRQHWRHHFVQIDSFPLVILVWYQSW